MNDRIRKNCGGCVKKRRKGKLQSRKKSKKKTKYEKSGLYKKEVKDKRKAEKETR